MITIINATNRPENQTGKVVHAYKKLLDEVGEDNQVFLISELQDDFIFASSFGQVSAHMNDLITTYFDAADKLVFVAPEYNGSYPGILKAFIDAVHPKHFAGKRAALVGVASGRAGNLRGMDHLTDVLHHLGVEVLSNKVPISKLNDLLDDAGNLTDEETLRMLNRQIAKLQAFN